MCIYIYIYIPREIIISPYLIMTPSFRNVCKCIQKKKTEISHLHKYLQQHLKFSPGASRFILITAERFLHLDWIN